MMSEVSTEVIYRKSYKNEEIKEFKCDEIKNKEGKN